MPDEDEFLPPMDGETLNTADVSRASDGVLVSINGRIYSMSPKDAVELCGRILGAVFVSL